MHLVRFCHQLTMETQMINNFGVKTAIPAIPVKYVLYARKID